MRALRAEEGYALWAPVYAAETAVSALENEVVCALPVPRACESLLDVGCGTARRLADSKAARATGVDLSAAMLREAAAVPDLAVAHAAALPFRDGTFDRVWCRLVIGHLREVGPAYTELARVCTVGGYIIVTDFHPRAATAGHRRTFRDAAGMLHELQHHVHSFASHVTVARRVHLQLASHRVGTVGPGVRDFYARAGRLAAYDEQRGLPLVLALAFRRLA